MIAFIPHQQSSDAIVNQYLAELAEAGFSGDIEQSYASRLAVATDNSVYQTLPQAVLLPRTTQDIQVALQLAAKPEYNELHFLPRGGGTGTNGQSLGYGIVLDVSRHMRGILEINVEQRWVRVQAGVIKDQLNDFLKPYGFFFAPDLSTSNRATVGGMISTDASGQGSLVYGKTSDHVLALSSVLVNGESLHTEKMAIEVAEQKAQQANLEGQLYRTVMTIGREQRPLILEKFPRLNRFLTGYDLEHIYNEELTEFDLSRVITGAEGSLAVVTEAKLNITPLAPYKVLINVKYDSFQSALRNAPFLVAANATSVETVDSKVLNLARQDIIWHSVKAFIEDVPGKDMQGLNMVEFNAEHADDMTDKVDALCRKLDAMLANHEAGIIGYQLTSNKDDIAKIYAMRKKAVGLLGNTQGAKKPIAFAEDTAVPPENLADFIVEFRQLLDSHGLQYGMFGHVDAGVLHVRPALDMCDPEQEVLLRKISDQVVALTAKYRGLMWGEHGKGYRSEYGPAFFGDTLFTELRRIKAAFDPSNKLNPGKICTPLHSAAQLVSVDDTKRGYYDRQIPVAVKDSFATTVNCNGNGLCFSYEQQSPMCPSYKVTNDRVQSPKGRAGLVREWLRLQSSQGVDIEKAEQQLLAGRGPSWLQKWRARGSESADFSAQVKASLDTCLACKACSSQCPIKVDVPTFRARFLNLYHSRYLRPLKDHVVAAVEQSTPLMAHLPRLSNLLMNNPLSQKILAKTIGYVDTPALSVPSLYQRVADSDWLDIDSVKALADHERSRMVVLVQDPFTSFYEAELVQAFITVAKSLGYQPKVLPFIANGKPQHVKGFLAKFKNTALAASKTLNQLAQLNVPMVGLDASLVLCYRDEYQQVLGAARGSFNVQVSHEWLSKVVQTALAAEQPLPQLINDGNFALFNHCTEKTALPNSSGDWQAILAAFGMKANAIATGCCGMAGTFGHELDHQDESKALYELSWQKPLSQLNDKQVLATGFSCRCQVKRFNGFKPRHPLQAIADALST